MKTMNRVTLMGNLTADPHIKQTKDGHTVSDMSIATNYRIKGGDEKEDRVKTDFHKVISWHKKAEVCEKFLRKGSPVFVEGRLSNHSYIAKDGTKKYVTEIIATDITVLKFPDELKKVPIDEETA